MSIEHSRWTLPNNATSPARLISDRKIAMIDEAAAAGAVLEGDGY
ncbi:MULTISPECIES: hypothetical protein [Bradyrhizobium]